MNRTGTVYLQFVPGRYGSITLARATNKKPGAYGSNAELVTGAIVVKLNVSIPNAAFEPIEPEATLVIPEELIQRPVLVEAAQA